MVVDEERSQLGGAQVEIVGADLSERALEKAQSGLYTQFEVQKGLPIRSLLGHFERRDEMWAVNPRLRSMVQWRRVNLNADLRGLGRFDIVFCRNVLTGMEPLAQKRLLGQFAGLLARDGVLVLGKDESARDLSQAFQPRGAAVYAVDPAFRHAA
jgi:chemotaxis protein methyltransferase CheR